jgi:hypothetical protein
LTGDEHTDNEAHERPPATAATTATSTSKSDQVVVIKNEDKLSEVESSHTQTATNRQSDRSTEKRTVQSAVTSSDKMQMTLQMAPTKAPEDQAMTIMRSILNNNNKLEAKLSEEKMRESEAADVAAEGKKTSTANKKKAKRAGKRSDGKAGAAARRAKTRDEMFALYCEFGEFGTKGSHFLALVSNILRDSLEGILTNSELYYKDLAVQNRQITHKGSLKDNYSEFAEAMIAKLKSYYNQCERYINQCLKVLHILSFSLIYCQFYKVE